MATIVCTVAAFRSGLNIFKREALALALEDAGPNGPRNVVNEEDAEIVREFIRKEAKSSLKYMESELGINAASIYRILTENLRYVKVCAKFVPHVRRSRRII